MVPQGSGPSLTAHGRKVASLPLDPIYAHLIFHAVKLECVKEVLTAVAMLSAENVLFFPPPGETRHRLDAT
jgi:HrpA-like RNA helicase